MSQATKRKHVVKEVMEDYMVPSGQQQIVRVLGSPGNNLHEVITAKGEKFLVSMPTKFRKNIWIKRGDFLIVDPIEEGEKVKAEMAFVLYKAHIQYLQKEGFWPEEFQTDSRENDITKVNSCSLPASQDSLQNVSEEKSDGEEENSGSDNDDSDLFVNTNRINYEYSESEEEESEDDSEEDEN
ncbi:probable RNA-binding protein EIF1AD [Protopterus annectens]|uniref:probable RNA-binding protein EIF1AD n=1 Tax=Protopterus annectens TaxID=7888 RepID=UPI001CF9AA3B|nr:probable RNA-binding protein EIF1AD [Protopterus annectens]XP_043929724.1 probable RNA-binding protein EIF1AD [Protopterus annectens]